MWYRADNDLLGPQIGTDFMLCLTPRFKIGAEVDAGVFGTSSKQQTDVLHTTTVSTRQAMLPLVHWLNWSKTMMSHLWAKPVLMASLLLLHVCHCDSVIRSCMLTGVATATENFNTAAPFNPRTAFLDNDGDVFFHGANLGMEWTWVVQRANRFCISRRVSARRFSFCVFERNLVHRSRTSTESLDVICNRFAYALARPSRTMAQRIAVTRPGVEATERSEPTGLFRLAFIGFVSRRPPE